MKTFDSFAGLGGNCVTYRLYDDDLGLDLWRHPGPVGGMHPDLHGTDGDDTFAGTPGDDRYFGEGGNDTISGGAGRDHLFGGDGDDVINGGSGNDVIEVGTGHDIVHGGDGNDLVKLSANDGGDTIYGGNGNDVIWDELSKLYGGAGDDMLRGGGAVIKGGSGNDILVIDNAFVRDDAIHSVWGGSGSDDLQFYADSAQTDGGREKIHDLSNDDIIDLSQVDADSTHPGLQHFKIVSQADNKPGELTISYDAAHDRTVIDLYTDHGPKPDGVIWAPGNHADFTHFILGG